MNKTVDAIIEKNKPQLIESLQMSIRIPSVEGNPEPGAPFGPEVRRALNHALATARDLGLKTTDMEGYVGCAEYGEGEEMLGILCHLDVVPEGEGWNFPPYAAVIDNDIMYGRGTLDDKGPAFAAMYALHAIKEAGIKLRRRVRIILGTNEETGWGCMDYYKQHGEKPTLAFTPDGEYPVVNSEKGILHTTFQRRFPSRIRMNRYEQVDMIRHNDVLFDADIGISNRDGQDLISHNSAQIRQSAFGRGKPLPYDDIGQDASFLIGADRDEIHAFAAVVIFRQPEAFSVWEFVHRFTFSWDNPITRRKR